MEYLRTHQTLHVVQIPFYGTDTTMVFHFTFKEFYHCLHL